jgi:hypothetical protein
MYSVQHVRDVACATHEGAGGWDLKFRIAPDLANPACFCYHPARFVRFIAVACHQHNEMMPDTHCLALTTCLRRGLHGEDVDTLNCDVQH